MSRVSDSKALTYMRCVAEQVVELPREAARSAAKAAGDKIQNSFALRGVDAFVTDVTAAAASVSARGAAFIGTSAAAPVVVPVFCLESLVDIGS